MRVLMAWACLRRPPVPEGDTIAKVADYMRPRLVGKVLHGVCIAGAQAPELARRTVLAVDAHGKHLLLRLSPAGANGWVLRVHLGMFGSWHAYAAQARWQRPAHQASVVLDAGASGVFVCFSAQDAEVLRMAHSTADVSQSQKQEPTAEAMRLAHLGINLLDADADIALAQARAQARAPQTPMVDILLDQRIAAGLGNVYKSELLFAFGIAASACRLDVPASMLYSLFARGRAWLQMNMGGWPRTTTLDRRRYRLPRHVPRLWVYNRAGQPCLRCNTAILYARLGRHTRGTYWCPFCQPEHKILRADASDVLRLQQWQDLAIDKRRSPK